MICWKNRYINTNKQKTVKENDSFPKQIKELVLVKEKLKLAPDK